MSHTRKRVAAALLGDNKGGDHFDHLATGRTLVDTPRSPSQTARRKTLADGLPENAMHSDSRRCARVQG